MSFPNKKQAGLTLLELVLSLGILATATAGINSLISQSIEDNRSSIVALHLKTVGDAANEYIKDNYAGITSVATSTSPALIRVSDLIAGGYLTAGYSTTNARSQNTCVLVLEPSANNLTAIVATEGGDTIDDLTLGQIAANIGGAGGGVYSTANTTIKGAMGGYSVAVGNFANANSLTKKCDGTTAGAVAFTAGHPAMALWFADGNAISAALYRDSVPGNPSLNTMNTPIIMGAGTVQTSGGACTTIGAMGRDNTGKVMMCDGSTWKIQGGSAYWGDPVANFASLPVCNAALSWQTRIVQSPTTGTGARAYSCNGAGTWLALAVDDTGNLVVAGNTSTGSLGVTGNTTLGDLASDSVTVNGTTTFNSGLTIGNGTAASASNTLIVNRTATEGAACSPNGAVARDSVGLLLSCQLSKSLVKP